MPSALTFSYSSMRNSSSLSLGPRCSSSYMSMSSISASLASSTAFSAVPPTPMPSMPGGHQPAPIVGTRLQHPVHEAVARVHHDELRLVLAAAALGRDGRPPRCRPARARCGSRTACCRACSGARTADRPAPRRAAGCPDRDKPCARRRSRHRRSDAPSNPCQRTSMPIFRNTLTMPVSWQMGRCPSAHMREFVRICAIASFAAGPCSALVGAGESRM